MSDELKSAASGGKSEAWLVVMQTPTGEHTGRRLAISPVGARLGGPDEEFPIQPESGVRAEVESPLLTGSGWRLRPQVGELLLNGARILEPTELRPGEVFELDGYQYALICGSEADSQHHELVYRLTVVDTRSWLHNERYALESLDREVARAERDGSDLRVGWLVGFGRDLGAKEFRRLQRKLGNAVRRHVSREWTTAQVGQLEFLVQFPGQPEEVVLHHLDTIANEAAVETEGACDVRVGAAVWDGKMPATVFYADARRAMVQESG